MSFESKITRVESATSVSMEDRTDKDWEDRLKVSLKTKGSEDIYSLKLGSYTIPVNGNRATCTGTGESTQAEFLTYAKANYDKKDFKDAIKKTISTINKARAART